MATAKGIGTPWTVFESIPSHASEPYNSRKMIHRLEISFITTIHYIIDVFFIPVVFNIVLVFECWRWRIKIVFLHWKVNITCEGNIRVFFSYILFHINFISVRNMRNDEKNLIVKMGKTMKKRRWKKKRKKKKVRIFCGQNWTSVDVHKISCWSPDRFPVASSTIKNHKHLLSFFRFFARKSYFRGQRVDLP
jgi:hypothetical protein